MSVARHQPPALLMQFAGVPCDVRSDLGLQRGGKHPPRPPHDLVDQRRAVNLACWRVLVVGDYREHGRTLPTRGLNLDRLWGWAGRVRHRAPYRDGSTQDDRV